MSMQVTVVEMDDETLWNGAKVRNVFSNVVKEIKVIPKDKTIYQCVQDGSFDPAVNIDFESVMFNKTRFELVHED